MSGLYPVRRKGGENVTTLLALQAPAQREMPGTWTTESLAGHECDLYEPPERNPHGYVVLYLHGVHLNRLADKSAFVEQFDRRGLPVVAPVTQRSWWTDKICNEFDPRI